MKKEFKGAGKGNRPTIGYNYKKWFENYDNVFPKKNITSKNEKNYEKYNKETN